MRNAIRRILTAGLSAVFLTAFIFLTPLAAAAQSDSAAPPLLPAHEGETSAAPSPAPAPKAAPKAATSKSGKNAAEPQEAKGPKIVTVNHRWVMGSGETIADAKRMCRAEAEREIVEQAGVVVESVSEVENFVLTRDQSRSYAAALVQVQSSEERLEPTKDGMAVVCTVRAKVDKADLSKGLRELADDPAAARRAEDAWGRTEKLSNEERELRAASPAPGTQGWQALQDKRRDLSRSLDELRRKKAAVVQGIEEETRRAAELAEPGMTVSEIEGMLGSPRAVLPQNERGYTCGQWGEVWVVFRHGVAECVRSRLQARPGVGECQCDGLSTSILKQ